MDLMKQQEEQCERCLSYTMKYDYKSGLFKCFQSKCGFIKSLTVITYEDETISYEEGAKTRIEQANDRRYVFDSNGNGTISSSDFTQFAYDDNKKKQQKQNNTTIAKSTLQPGCNASTTPNVRTQIDDIGDRIQKEVYACKRQIKKWIDFLDNKKFLFEIIENFQELVNLDTHCTVPSVKRKAASSFCFIMAKQQHFSFNNSLSNIGCPLVHNIYNLSLFVSLGSSIDLESVADHTGVSLNEIIKEQDKMSQLKFPNSHRSSEILLSTTAKSALNNNNNNNNSNNPNGKINSTSSTAASVRCEWTQLCFSYLEKIFAAKKDEMKGWIAFSTGQQAQRPQMKREKGIGLMDILDEEDRNVFVELEKNIRALNPSKVKYENNKISASMVLLFCQLTLKKEVQFSELIVFADALALQEATVLKYYNKILYPHRVELLANIEWKARKSLSQLQIFS